MTREIRENNISMKRLGYAIGMMLLFVAGNAVMAWRSELLLDELFCLFAVSIFFLLAFFLSLMKKRLLDVLPTGQSTNYKRIFWTLVVAWVMYILFTYCPDYFAPVMLVAILFTTTMDDASAIALSIYFLILQCVTKGLSVNAFYCYSILCVLGILLSAFLSQKTRKESVYIYVILFLLNAMIPIIFYYIAFLEVNAKVFVFGLFSGLLQSILVMIMFLPLKKSATEEEKRRYIYLCEDNYPLVQDIKSFSMAEYNHGRRVSKLSAFCASEIGAKVDTAALAGFYYRLGKMEGEPEIDNALKLANQHCFPHDVMDIMEEYGGILRRPQTKESAIVHMVDALVTKIELLGADTMSSTWNQDMVIYQTLNELSQQGLYDESGMSMNQFLRIREKLVQEGSIL